MEFLYFPEDKSEYIPGIISVVVIFILSLLIMWLLIRASRKQVKQLQDKGYPVVYKGPLDEEHRTDEQQKKAELQKQAGLKENPRKDRES
ncbi:hypothetical protein [Planococcus sp. NCCP-2050]|uniref:hypothetical protein n=1 Tax=Planococcus sp. NCCP-2050 TaxID=2944679 RepID=UPI0020414D80|nr:hypothetical protein [Planococcus sp. NCCP-2050]GKW46393.1 hypothetical protein NCCP2050_20850 [Planococcus sp. NCCP-2050]